MGKAKFSLENNTSKDTSTETFRVLDTPSRVTSGSLKTNDGELKTVQKVPNFTYAQFANNIKDVILEVEHDRMLNCFLQHNELYVTFDEYKVLQLKPLKQGEDFIFECRLAVIDIENRPMTIMVFRQRTPDPNTDAYLVGNRKTKKLTIKQKDKVLWSPGKQSKKVVGPENFPCLFSRTDLWTSTSVFKLFDNENSDEELFLSYKNGQFLLKNISNHPKDHPDTHFTIQSPNRQSIDYGGTDDEILNKMNNDNEPKLNVNNTNSNNPNLFKTITNLFNCFKRNNSN